MPGQRPEAGAAGHSSSSSRWATICLTAAAGTALGAGIALYLRSKYRYGPERQRSKPAYRPCGRKTSVGPQPASGRVGGISNAADGHTPAEEAASGNEMHGPYDSVTSVAMSLLSHEMAPPQQLAEQQQQRMQERQHNHLQEQQSQQPQQQQPGRALGDSCGDAGHAGPSKFGRRSLLQELAAMRQAEAAAASSGSPSDGSWRQHTSGGGYSGSSSKSRSSGVRSGSHSRNTEGPTAWNHVLAGSPIQKMPSPAASDKRAKSLDLMKAMRAAHPGAMSDGEIPLDDLKLCFRPDGSPWFLGKGSFGKVYKGMLKGEEVAVKVFPLQSSEHSEADFRSEVLLLRACADKRVVAFKGAVTSAPGHLLMVMELMPNGDLRRALQADAEDCDLRWHMKRRGPSGGIQEGLGRVIAMDIARGLAFLHAHHIVHLDMKSPNVLLDKQYHAKIGDVGLARFMPRDYMSAQAAVGTFAWSAPEMLMNERCSTKVDVFALGVIMWELCTGESPVRGRLRTLRVPEDCPQGVKDLIEQCMERRSSDRPTAEQVAKLLAKPETLQQPLPARSTAPPTLSPQARDRSVREQLREKHWAMALAVHGDEETAKAAGSNRLELECALEHTDVALFCAYINVVKQCLEDAAINDPCSSVRARLNQLVFVWRDLVTLHMRESSRIMMEARFTNIETTAQMDALADQLLLQMQSEEPAAGSGGGGGSGGHGNRQQRRNREVVRDPDAMDMRRVIVAIGLTDDQRTATITERQRVAASLDALHAERRVLVKQLRGLTSTAGDGSYEQAVQASVRLRTNMEEEGKETNAFQLWFTCELISPLQHARCDAAAFPFPPDPLTIGQLLQESASDEDSPAGSVGATAQLVTPPVGIL